MQQEASAHHAPQVDVLVLEQLRDAEEDLRLFLLRHAYMEAASLIAFSQMLGACMQSQQQGASRCAPTLKTSHKNGEAPGMTAHLTESLSLAEKIQQLCDDLLTASTRDLSSLCDT